MSLEGDDFDDGDDDDEPPFECKCAKCPKQADTKVILDGEAEGCFYFCPECFEDIRKDIRQLKKEYRALSKMLPENEVNAVILTKINALFATKKVVN